MGNFHRGGPRAPISQDWKTTAHSMSMNLRFPVVPGSKAVPNANLTSVEFHLLLNLDPVISHYLISSLMLLRNFSNVI